MTTAKMVKALETHLATIVNKDIVAWENANFLPPEGAYYEVNTLFAEPESFGFGDEMTRQQGFMQVACKFPPNTGAGAARAQGDVIAAAFKRGLSLVADDVTTIIETAPEVGPGSNEAGRYVIRVKIRFFANIQKDA